MKNKTKIDMSHVPCNSKNTTDIKVGDFILIKLEALGNLQKLYIGQILKIDDDKNFEVQFLRKTQKNTFIYPQIEDISYIHDDQILKLLTQPIMNRREEFLFEKTEMINFNIF